MDSGNSSEHGNQVEYIDWLTLASYKFAPYTRLVAFVRELDRQPWDGAKWLQYEGFRNKSGFFHGHATQSNDKEHYVIKIPGQLTTQWWRRLVEHPDRELFYATRIDLQKTIPAPEWWRPRDLVDWLDEGGKSVTLIESPTGRTVYIGSRKSARFCRIYEKDFGETYLRLEIELKRGNAKRTWEHLCNGIEPAALYLSHLNNLPLPERVKADYSPHSVQPVDVHLKQHEADVEGKLKWLQSLTDTFQAMANDHTIGQQVRDIFYSLALEKIDHDNVD